MAARPAARTARRVQAKLTIGQAHDPLEREAERIAQQVMGTTAGVQRECACGGTCPRCRQDECSGEAELHAKADSPSAAVGPAAPPGVETVLRAAGTPLEAGDAAFFGPRFGRNFDSVRIHANAAAAASAAQIGARAYTAGHDIVFGAGQYAPGSRVGRSLIAHELAHVLQQDGGAERVQRTPDEDRARSISAYQEGWDWLTGQHPPLRVFDGDALMTDELRRHARFVELRTGIADSVCIECAAAPQSGHLGPERFSYSLEGWMGPFLYARDYVGVPLLYPALGSALGSNPTVSYLGSFWGTWEADFTCGGDASVTFLVRNRTGLTSGTRFPVLGYQQVNTPTGPQARPSMEDWIADPAQTYVDYGGVTVPGGIVNDRPAPGPMTTVEQEFRWAENLALSAVCPAASESL